MDPAYELKRLADVTRGLRISKRLAKGERRSREETGRMQRERLAELTRHAREHSPYYREALAGGELPVLTKRILMDRFDDIVCDRRLRRDALLAHLDGLEDDALYLGRYRVMTTSGSSGSKALYVYDRAGWAAIVGQYLRFADVAGARPRIPRARLAGVVGGVPTHMSRRCGATLSIGIHKALVLAVTMPVAEIVAQLNAFRPDYLHAYPSMAILLADEQEAGRLRIAPEVVITASELCTAEMTARIERAFGVRPHDLYANTEGGWSVACEHGSKHLVEELAIVENVDEDGRPVPDGERGAKLLLTNLYNHVQPLIRFEVNDVVTIDPEPCPCGRTARRIAGIEGRSDSVLRLAGVAVHPLQFDVVTADRGVREFQVLQRGDGVHVRVVVREGQPAEEVAERLREHVGARLAALGVRDPHVKVEPCAALERPPAGKLQLVVAESAVTAHA
jgi:phenylacetate-coenzyme A ligase PaaK-like adenylate-forming protein